MAGLNIPGVTDQYNTNETIEKLMEVEKVPLTREQKQLETYKSQQEAWRDINTKLSSLRDQTKTLYSYENPFNNKLTKSTEENAVTAEANRGAEIQSFKVDVLQVATSDRFLTDELKADSKVPSGVYTYKVGEKQITINWKGGTLKDFSNAINKRSNGVVKSMIVGESNGNKALLIEAINTGKENKLVFEGDAKTYALSSGMIVPSKANAQTINKAGIVQPAKDLEIVIKNDVVSNKNNVISFSVTAKNTEDISDKYNESLSNPEINSSGFAEFEGIKINNNLSNTQLPSSQNQQKMEKVETSSVVFAVSKDGKEEEIKTEDLLSGKTQNIELDVSKYPDLKSIKIKNQNTGNIINVSEIKVANSSASLGYEPKHPVSVADDSVIKYEGIKITRPKNEIDDVVPEVTLNLHDKTDKTATISVVSDKEASKDALLQFVGQYNQTVAQINILSQNKPEIINEIDYFTDDEKKQAEERLGMFSTDFTLSSIKSNMQNILISSYNFDDQATITMLSQIGIATNASGYSGGYSESKLRGYLEVDEKKLDSALENHMDEVRQLFGFDSDGDLIVDKGIAYQLDKQISAYTQTGGILASKTSGLDSKIKSSESKISKLETQMDDKEADLRSKYSQMESSLNSLESQQNSISNFSKQQSKN